MIYLYLIAGIAIVILLVYVVAHMYVVKCAWCGKFMGFGFHPKGKWMTSHSICKKCKKGYWDD